MPKSREPTRGEKVIAFIEEFCRVPEGKLIGKPMQLLKFQKEFVLDVYDNPNGTSRAYLSIGRKNGKTTLIAALVLAHLVGPEAIPNSQIISGARSRKQAALVYKLAEKMVLLNPALSKIIRRVPSDKMLVGLYCNVEYTAISAEAGTAHGLSPVVAILDEVGQVKGPYDAFVEAIETSQGAYENPLLFAISTQAARDGDLFSIWIDDARNSQDPRIVCHVYSAPEDCDLMDPEAWKAANPALDQFRALDDLKDLANRAKRQPSTENSFRWLFLNQRIEATSPFVSRGVWMACNGSVNPLREGTRVFGALDLSAVHDLTAKVYVHHEDGLWHVHPTFWLPAHGLREKSQQDRVPYDVWHKQGFLKTTPGKSVDYEFVAATLWEDHQRYEIVKIAFDRWNWRHLKPYLLKVGFMEEELEGDKAIFVQMGQGYQSMSPALRTTETLLLEEKLRHGGHPVLTMCAANAITTSDPAGNRKLDKSKATGRIDGLQALAMALAIADTFEQKREPEFQILFFG